ncbi:MAG: phage portal protein [Rhizobiales bacterium]|nr:phage portal protein [Hyphomicrobiales bacterium]
MGLYNWLFSRSWNEVVAPMASVQSASGGTVISTPHDLDEALRSGNVTQSGVSVTAGKAMSVAAVYASVRIISGAVATLPLHLKRRVDALTREDASDLNLWNVIRRKPNRWQKPAQFRRMLQAHVLLLGNGYALIVRSRGEVQELIPLDPHRVKVRQLDDLSLEYTWTRKDGRKIIFRQDEIFHLFGLTLDGITGVTPLTYARETIGLALAQESHGATQFKNGLNVGGYLKSEKALGEAGRATLRASMDEYRAEGERAGKWMVLEDGLTAEMLTMSAVDAQWIESRKFTRSEIAMFFGVPPHMIGDTENSTNWGTGLEQQSNAFKAFSLEDHLTMWEEACNLDLLTEQQSDIFFRFNRSALVRADTKARWASHVQSLQWGVSSPNEIRALEDQNPREGGDVYYDPPNTAGDTTTKDVNNEP